MAIAAYEEVLNVYKSAASLDQEVKTKEIQLQTAVAVSEALKTTTETLAALAAKQPQASAALAATKKIAVLPKLPIFERDREQYQV